MKRQLLHDNKLRLLTFLFAISFASSSWAWYVDPIDGVEYDLIFDDNHNPISAYVWDHNENITTAVIRSSVIAYDEYGKDKITKSVPVTSIGEYAFDGCRGLTSVTIPNSVTTIGEYAFRGCSGLTSVTIPNSVTTIGEYAFEGCSGLTSVTIPNSVTSINWSAFEDCSNLTSVAINSNAILSTSSIEGIFGDQVQNYIIGNDVTSIGDHAFHDCRGLTSVTIGNSVTSIGRYAFRGCSGLTSVTIPNSVTTIGEYAFAGCSGLTSVTIPNSVTSINWGAFEDCSGLTSVTIGNSVTSIEDYAFNHCSGLTSVTIGNSVKSIGYCAFAGCSGLTSVTIPNSVTSVGDYAFASCSGLMSVTIPNSVTSIGEGAFSNCSGLTSVTIGNSVTSIGESAFSGCSSLTSVTIPNSVTSIGRDAFYLCSGLTSVTIGNSVTTIGDNAFEGCSGLEKVIVDDIAAWCNISFSLYDANPLYYAHHIYSDENTEITDLVIPNSVTSISSYAFLCCRGLTSVTIGNSVTSIGGWAFGYCRGLKKVIVEDIAAWCDISFANSYANPLYYANHIYSDENTEITDLVIPNSVTSIGWGAFLNCSGLTSVTIPNSVTTIGEYAFEGCSGLTSVTIPNSVTSIGEDAFYDCSGLTEIISQIEKPFALASWPFNGVNKSIPVYVPIGTKSLYENTGDWKYFTNITERGLAPKVKGESEDYGSSGKISSSTNLSSTVIDDVYYNIPNVAGGYDAASGSVVLRKATADEQVQGIVGKDVFDADVAANFNGMILLLPAGTGALSIDAEALGNMSLKIKIGEGEPTVHQLNGKQTVSVPYSNTVSTYVYIYADQSSGAKSLYAPASDNALRIYRISLQDTNTTAIEQVATAEAKTVSRCVKGIYTLSGVKVSDDTADLKTLPRGIYIVNGRKVAVK